jgi:hypothetical protein
MQQQTGQSLKNSMFRKTTHGDSTLNTASYHLFGKGFPTVEGIQ